MDTALRDLCSKIQDTLKLSAAIGHPNELEADVVLWPWRIGPAQQLNRNLPDRVDGSRTRSTRHWVDLSFVVLSPSALNNLIRVAQCAFENPILLAGGSRYKLSEQPLREELQVALLAAGGIRMQPVLNYILVEAVREG